MLTHTAYSKAYPTETAQGYVWEVHCLDCDKTIGTMTSEILLRAVLATSEKGGIKCPKCRETCCENCGDNWELNKVEPYDLYEVTEWPSKMRLCTVCVLEMKVANRLPEEEEWL